jgi:GH15 family glucan-1,4-alpha-glucosidase
MPTDAREPEELIENHGVIGDLRSVALVSTEGAIDFLCYPEFDSPTVFAALLDPAKGGAFTLRPERDDFVANQLYVPETNVLLTRFLLGDGIVEVTDLMPVSDEPALHWVLRRVKVLGAQTRITLRCDPRFDYARASHRTDCVGGTVVFTPLENAAPSMELSATVNLEVADGAAVAALVLEPGASACFAFGPAGEVPVGDELTDAFERHLGTTLRYWKAWSAKSSYRGRWRELVSRSALLLKVLTSERHGSLIAAPTFALPEELGGERNWDYRYTWLRDASFTLYALSRLGYIEESRHFSGWIKARLEIEGDESPFQTMYGADGRKDLEEIELPNLAGYAGSKPVRIGNAAYRQLQLDIYGELFDAAYLSSKYGDGIPYEAWERMKQVLQWLSRHWQDPDEGIWEVRGGRREFLHSRLMCWVAFDRAIRLASKRSLSGPLDWMEQTRDAIVRDIHENFWDDERKTFVQYKGSKAVDASTLLMPLMRFISPADPRWLSTLDVIERELTVDTHVKRYLNESSVDGLPGREGSFTACSFWFVEALARSGRLARAHELFEKLVTHANHLGLYSEELAPQGRQLGNFPQALTHLALISAATYLDRALSNAKEPWS